MKRTAAITTIICGTVLFATAAENNYQQAIILSLEKKTNTRVLYYVVNTPITKDDPYYDVSVQLKDIAYSGRFTPRHADEELPDDWKAGSTVEARVRGHHLLLKSAAGTDVEFVITKKKRVTTGESAPGSASDK